MIITLLCKKDISGAFWDTVFDVISLVVSVGEVIANPSSPREAVEAVAKKLPDGRFLDANTGKVINGKYDLGHKYGSEFHRMRDEAMKKGLTQKQFNDLMNDPKLYQIEDPVLIESIDLK